MADHSAARPESLTGSLIVWDGWLLVTGLVFSFASGIIHAYYTVALAPAIAALVGIGVVTLWQARGDLVGRALLALVVGAGAGWTFELLGRADWNSWLRWLVLLCGAAAIAVVLAAPARLRRAGVVVAPLVALSLLAGRPTRSRPRRPHTPVRFPPRARPAAVSAASVADGRAATPAVALLRPAPATSVVVALAPPPVVPAAAWAARVR